MTNAKIKSFERLEAAARRYAAADRTDPFAYVRALSHIKSGLASVIRGETSKDWDVAGGATAFYSADVSMEERRINVGGREVTAVLPVYRNVVRP